MTLPIAYSGGFYFKPGSSIPCVVLTTDFILELTGTESLLRKTVPVVGFGPGSCVEAQLTSSFGTRGGIQ